MTEIPHPDADGTVVPVEVSPLGEAAELVITSTPPRQVRVAWVAGPDTIARLGRTLQPLAIGLLDEMVEVVAVCPEGIDTSDLPSPPIEILNYGRLNYWFIHTQAADALAAELKSHDVQLLHALDVSAADLTRRLAATLDCPYIVSSYSIGDGGTLGTLGQNLVGVLAASDSIRMDLLEHHVATAEKIHVLRPGVYQVRHTTLFDHPQQSVAIVAGGRLDDYAAFRAVLRCFADLRARDYDCVFFIIGNGKAERQIRHEAERLGLLNSLTFVDRQGQTELAGIFKAADIYIAPVASSSIDMQALLAMAAGDPVLAAEGGCSDFMIDGQTVLTYRAGDAEGLLARLTSLLDNHAAARELAENTLVYLHEHYSPAKMVASLAALYRTATSPTVL